MGGILCGCRTTGNEVPEYLRRLTDDLADLAVLFRDWGPFEFQSSPLYRTLSPVVADDPVLLELVATRTPGQHPTVLFFAAVHHLVLSGTEHRLAEAFPSVTTDVRPPEEATSDFVDFCHTHLDELGRLVRTRLVQTNVVRRASALRLALAAVGEQVDGVHLVEIGTSAGIHLRHDRYGYVIGGRRSGRADAAVEIVTDWVSTTDVPDLDRQPTVLSATGIDRNPLDPKSDDDRRWLQALVWPENRLQAELLERALVVVADDPPRLLRGNVTERAGALARELPAGEPRVVFHAATRGHVPREQLPAFDDAIAGLGEDAPLFVVSLESPRPGDPQPTADGPSFVLRLQEPGAEDRIVALVDAHGAWIEPRG